MVMLATALALGAQADAGWQPMPAEGQIPPLLFGCSTQAGGFYDLYLYRNTNGDHVRIGHEPPGRQPDAYRRTILRDAFRSAARRETAEARSYRLEYRGNDRAGVPTRITVIMSAPQPADTNGIRTATFTMTQGGRSVTQDCRSAPPPPGGAGE
jgi:hypothetical protein